MPLDRENRALKDQPEELQVQIGGVAICAGVDEGKYADDDRCILCSLVVAGACGETRP
jgi:hypothetical protein